MSESKDSSSLKGRHILVTGGAGYIGSHTVVELQAQGATITIIDSLVNASAVCVDRVAEITGVRPAFHRIDLTDLPALEGFFATAPKFDACIHFAGLKAVGESSQKPLLYYENNLIGTIYLLRMLQKHGCTRLVFSSSATVYGLTDKVPIKETEPLDATNPYGRTKLMIEQMLRDLPKGEGGEAWRIVILRYFNPIGAHSSGLIGEDPRGIPNNLLPYITQVAVGRLPHLNVFGDDYPTKDGTGVRDYIHVVDLARGHVAALRRGVFAESSRPLVDEFNLGTGRGYSVLELLGEMEKACGKTLPYKVVARRPGDVAICYADPTKAERELEWKATLGIDRGVQDSWRWQSSNPEGFATKRS